MRLKDNVIEVDYDNKNISHGSSTEGQKVFQPYLEKWKAI